jgi:hypothetical protein
MKQKRISEIIMFIIALGVGRLAMTFMPNFNPIGAMALFGGAVLASKKLAYIIPLAALLIGDLVYAGINSGYTDYLLMRHDSSILFVYVAFGLSVWLGHRYLSNGRTFGRVLGTAALSSVLFFALSNFGSFLAFYPATPEGLLAAYAAGLAFFQNDPLQNFFLNGLVSTMAFSAVAFYAYDLSAKVFKTKTITVTD